jgi:hypothetical protein
MPTLEENQAQIELSNLRYRLKDAEALSINLANMLSDIDRREEAGRAILREVEALGGSEHVGDQQNASKGLAKLATERTALQARILGCQQRQTVIRAQIGQMDAPKLDRLGRIGELFQRLSATK